MHDPASSDPREASRESVSGVPRRVLVYGVTGSGKTTAAERISRATGIPWTSVDDLTWEPGWVSVPAEEQRRRIAEVCAHDCWLLDTAYGQWIDIPLASAEAVVALDYPRWFSLQRLLRRTLRRVVDKRPVCNGNTETWRQVPPLLPPGRPVSRQAGRRERARNAPSTVREAMPAPPVRTISP